jgi:hypothetical protein
MRLTAIVLLSLGLSACGEEPGAGFELVRMTSEDASHYGVGVDHPRSQAAASSCLNGCDSGWAHGNGIDSNGASVWGSVYHPDANGTEWYAFWFDTFRDTNYIDVMPRYYNGVATCVPQNLSYYYSGTNGQWNFIANIPMVPDLPNGDFYRLYFPTKLANGVLLYTGALRDDGYGGYYFQLAEAWAGKS